MKRRNISSNVGFLLVHSIIRTCMDRTYVSSTKIFVTHLCVRLNTLTYYFTRHFLSDTNDKERRRRLDSRTRFDPDTRFISFIYLFIYSNFCENIDE